MQAELRTYGAALVGRVQIPPFKKLPEVLVWGSRTFVLAGPGDGDGVPVYAEGCAFTITGGLLPDPGKPRGLIRDDPCPDCGGRLLEGGTIHGGHSLHCEKCGWAGLEGQQAPANSPAEAMADFRAAMAEDGVPKIIADVKERGRLAAESRLRLPELQRVPTEHGEKVSTSGRIVDLHGPTPDPETDATGQHKGYWVLSEEERAKGFVRPVRRSYRHVGPPGPKHVLRELTAEEQERHADCGYIRFEPYPESEAPRTGRYWTREQLNAVGRGCGNVTTMGTAIAETYARDPSFYGSTFCCACGKHLTVGEQGEFVWEGTDERVGT